MVYFKNYDDELSTAIYEKQQKALKNMPANLKEIETFEIPLRPYNITGLENVRALLKEIILKCSENT